MADFIQNGSGVVIDASGAGSAVAEVNKLKDKIRSTIYPNGAGAIKAADHQELLLEMADMFTDLDKSKIAKNADDYYPQLSVGTADTLAGVDVVDSNFTFRRSGGGAIADGVARVQSIKGNSIVWNQLAKSFEEADIRPDVNGTYQGNGITIVNWGEYQPFRFNVQFTKTIGHQYLLLLNYENTSADQNILIPKGGGSYMYYSVGKIVYFFANSQIGTGGFEDYLSIYLYTTTEGTITLSELSIYDLTKMFGEGNEPTTIAEFYSRIPMGVDLNAYNEGEIIDCKVEGIVSIGRNAWDEQWEKGWIDANGNFVATDSQIRSRNYNPCLPNTQYYVTSPQLLGIAFYDLHKQFITYIYSSNALLTTPPNAAYFRFLVVSAYGTTYKNDICINLSDSDFNGQYEPYLAVGEDLSIARKYFPNGMRSAGNARDEIRYNKATNRWEKVQKIGEVDLGSLSWNYSQGVFITYISDMKGIANTNVALMARYNASKSVYGEELYDNVENKVYKTNGGAVGGVKSLAISDSEFNNPTSFKAAMSGVMLYYELAEPIVTEIEEKDFNLDFSVWNNGTEQAIAEGKSSALAADITYGFNAVGLIKQLRTIVEAMQAKLANL